MSRQHHHLKTESHYYQLVEAGIKTFELRRDDRNFQVGDMLYLEETVSGQYTGRSLPPIEIKYILEGGKFGLQVGYCILQL
jgi:ParB family transcriptional regulator, chromosome partitioning protein